MPLCAILAGRLASVPTTVRCCAVVARCTTAAGVVAALPCAMKASQISAAIASPMYTTTV
ncbi:hypothetical protein D3C72_2240060 [compost metagenome]